jgi:BlaI family transcriptional regulator, penicillinase repressor
LSFKLRSDAVGRDAETVADAELVILEELWKTGPLTVRQLAHVLYAPVNGAQCATVQKLLDRLEAKECVGSDRTVRPHIYRPTIDRDELIARRLRATADRLCGGSLIPLLTNLVRTSRLDAQERRQVRAVLEELDQKSKAKSSGSDARGRT